LLRRSIVIWRERGTHRDIVKHPQHALFFRVTGPTSPRQLGSGLITILSVSGPDMSVDAPPDVPLLWALRETLG
jgi:hypothetical protein